VQDLPDDSPDALVPAAATRLVRPQADEIRSATVEWDASGGVLPDAAADVCPSVGLLDAVAGRSAVPGQGVLLPDVALPMLLALAAEPCRQVADQSAEQSCAASVSSAVVVPVATAEPASLPAAQLVPPEV
jgi:hypothetical protein